MLVIQVQQVSPRPWWPLGWKFHLPEPVSQIQIFQILEVQLNAWRPWQTGKYPVTSHITRELIFQSFADSLMRPTVMTAMNDSFCSKRALYVLTLSLLFCINSQSQPTPRNLASDSGSAPDLIFPTEATPIAEAIYPKMLLLKPDGDGPFPATMLSGITQHLYVMRLTKLSV